MNDSWNQLWTAKDGSTSCTTFLQEEEVYTCRHLDLSEWSRLCDYVEATDRLHCQNVVRGGDKAFFYLSKCNSNLSYKLVQCLHDKQNIIHKELTFLVATQTAGRTSINKTAFHYLESLLLTVMA